MHSLTKFQVHQSFKELNDKILSDFIAIRVGQYSIFMGVISKFTLERSSRAAVYRDCSFLEHSLGFM
jgi:hypothetical protein